MEKMINEEQSETLRALSSKAAEVSTLKKKILDQEKELQKIEELNDHYDEREEKAKKEIKEISE